MKVFLYIRVACADQLAAASQREELERYAKDKDYEVAAAVAADGISGVHTEGIMNFLLNEAKRQGIGTILTRDTSRISRDTSSFMRFERKFRENGIRFEYLSKPDNELPVTPMMEAFAAYIKTITALAVFSALVGLLLPEGKYRRYTELVLGILVLTAVLRPLLGLFHAAETGDLPLTRIEQEWSDTYNRYREEG